MVTGIGIVGLGVMGTRMLGAFRDHPATAVRAVWDPDPEAVARTRAAFPEVAVVDGPEAVAEAEGVACLYIAAPPSTHLPLAAMAFDRGRAVLCEKPLAIDVAGGRAAVARVAAEGLRAGVNFPQASAPALRTLGAELEAGALGKIAGVEAELVVSAWPETWQASARWLARAEQGGFVREVFSHMVFAARRLLGPLQLVQSKLVRPGPEEAETAAIVRLLAGGVPVTIRGRVAPGEPDVTTWTVTGTAGARRLRDWYGLESRADDGWRAVDLGEGDARAAAYRAQVAAVADLAEGRPTTVASFAEALDVQRLIEAAIRAGTA